MYTVGSVADIISGTNTPNKPKIIFKEVKSTPFDAKKKGRQPLQPQSGRNKGNMPKKINGFENSAKKGTPGKNKFQNSPGFSTKKSLEPKGRKSMELNDGGIKGKSPNKPKNFVQLQKSPKTPKNKSRKSVGPNSESKQGKTPKKPKNFDKARSPGQEIKQEPSESPLGEKSFDSQNKNIQGKTPNEPINFVQIQKSQVSPKRENNENDEGNTPKRLKTGSCALIDTIENPVQSKNANRRLKKKTKKQDEPEKERRTIFVGNIPLTTKKVDILKHFRKYGNVASCRFRGGAPANLKLSAKATFITKQFHPKTSTQNCYVVFENEESASKALEENGTLFKGNHIRVDNIINRPLPDQQKAIFIGGIPFDAKDEELWQVFSCCGEIDSVRLCRGLIKDGRMGRGVGFINFKNKDSVELALQMTDVKIGDRIVRIKRPSELERKGGKWKKQNRRQFRQNNNQNKPNNAEKKFPKKKKNNAPGNKKPGFLQQLTTTPDENGSTGKDQGIKKEISSPGNFAGTKFTDKKKKKKANKTMLRKKKISKMLAPKSE